MTPTPPRPVPPSHRPVQGPSLRSRVRATSVAVAALVVVGALAVAAVSVSGAATDHRHSVHVAADVPLASDEPAVPAGSQEVGVLDMFGNPLLDIDGEPLEVPLTALEPPRVPDDADAVPPAFDQPTEGDTEVNLFAAHLGTLNEVANDEDYSLVERFDLLRINGLLADAEGQPGGLDAFRDLLVTFEHEIPRGNGLAACATGATAAAQSDGTPVDLVAGPGAAQINAEVVATRAELECP